MEKDTLTAFLESLQEAFLGGDLDEMRSRFKLPVVIYSLAGVTVLRDEAEFEMIVSQYRSAIIAMAVDSSDQQIVEREPSVNSRLRVTVRTRDFNSHGKQVASSLIRYFLMETRDSYRIEMMEYLEAPLPPDEVERIVH